MFNSPPTAANNPYERRDHQYKAHPENVLPKERIIVYKEYNKMFALCINGNLSTLKLLYNRIIQSQGNFNLQT